MPSRLPWSSEDFGGNRPFAIDQGLAESYLEAYFELLPPGPLWDADQDAGLYNFGVSQAQEAAWAHTFVTGLATECNPLTVDAMLDEWEEILGLPDACGVSLLEADRKAAVIAAFTAHGGQSVAYYLNVLTQMYGPGVTLEERYNMPFIVGDGDTISQIVSAPDATYTFEYVTAQVGDGDAEGTPIWDSVMMFYWRVTVPGTGADAERATCLLDRIKPAHTVVVVLP